MKSKTEYPNGVVVLGEITKAYAEILTPEVLDFTANLARKFEKTRKQLLNKRLDREESFKAGQRPDFLKETEDIRNSDWTIGSIPHDLKNRRVEITGPVGNRKMVINALNSKASTYMTDFEDSLSPKWENVLNGQINMYDAVRRTISHTDAKGKAYKLDDKLATLIVRPRGWHLVEKHVLVDGEPISASIFDFALYFYHNTDALMKINSGPYFYLPKLESHLEARLWNDVFVEAQKNLGIPSGTIKATVLIETILAAFEMDEILYELKEHIVGLNCGRWDYIFSFIKKLRFDPKNIMPDRALITMSVPFMRDYMLLTIKTCHKRNAYAIGGMAAQIPIRGDDAANQIALDKVRDGKLLEAKNGHDGTWVAHPALVPIALASFDQYMKGDNQIAVKRDDVEVSAENLLAIPEGEISEKGLRINISAGIQYLAAWLSGSGAVPLNHLMEDAATAEIFRAQIWQWIRHPKGVLGDGRKITFELFKKMLDEELETLRNVLGEQPYQTGNYEQAASIFTELTENDDFVPFLTLPAYEYL